MYIEDIMEHGSLSSHTAGKLLPGKCYTLYRQLSHIRNSGTYLHTTFCIQTVWQRSNLKTTAYKKEILIADKEENQIKFCVIIFLNASIIIVFLY